MVITEARYCPACGRERDAAAPFCGGCGRRVADVDSGAPSAARVRPPWWAWPFSRRTAVRVMTAELALIVLLLAGLAVLAPQVIEYPCTLARRPVLGVLTARIEATCVQRWPVGLTGPSTIERRDPRVSVGLGAP